MGISLFIPFLQYRGQYVVFQQEFLIFIGNNPCFRVQVQKVEILADNGLEIRIQRRNLGASQEGDLFFQMADPPFIICFVSFLQSVRQSLGNTGFHFAGGGFREGKHQKLINIRMVCRILDQTGNPFRKDRCFSAAGGSRKKKILPSHRKGFFLFFCPVVTHGISPFSEAIVC